MGPFIGYEENEELWIWQQYFKISNGAVVLLLHY